VAAIHVDELSRWLRLDRTVLTTTVAVILWVLAFVGLTVNLLFWAAVDRTGSYSLHPLLLGIIPLGVQVLVILFLGLRRRSPSVIYYPLAFHLVVLLPLVFAGIYWSLSLHPGSCMNVSLTRLDSLYVTLGMFVTANFGDIVPVSEQCRGLVSAQYALDAVVVFVVIGLLVARLVERR
jgi:hypothetical protein